LFLGLFDCRWYFVGFAVPVTSPPIRVTDYDKGGETEAAATFNYRGATPDFHDLVN
jgi:hypothetical protein